MGSLRTFEDLDCWKKTSQLRRNLSGLVKKFPSEEKYKLVDQIIRASRSVTANIAEGYGRYHYKEFAQFCRQGRGSLYELIDHLIVACDEGYVSKQELIELKQEVHECLAILNGFINYLLKAKSNENTSTVEESIVHYQLADNELLTDNN